MDKEIDRSRKWTFFVHNCESRHYGTDLTLAELEALIPEEWNRDFNNLYLANWDRKNDLSITFQGNNAVVLYSDYKTGHHWSSCDLRRVHDPKAAEVIRLSPEDSEDFSFEGYRVIPKQEAFRILKHYMSYGQPIGLYLVGEDGKPQLSTT
ncbi:MAG TPA: hypothetical protein VNK04_11690 [Gemmataceae bacterium]|nr:hypothetical protein [Gemmataceae bacterium]